jgi:hypothetical protein
VSYRHSVCSTLLFPNMRARSQVMHTASVTGQAASGAREPCSPGLHMRVHFDGFKANWDEWYDQRDVERGER